MLLAAEERCARSAPPVVVESLEPAGAHDLTRLLRSERAQLTQTLLRSGAILFRGFGVTEPRDLATLVAATGGEGMPYVGGDSPRENLGHAVYTSTEAPRGVHIPLHHEMSYLSAYPRHLWMACVTPALRGGETTLADGRAVLEAMDPLVRQRFAAHGVRYHCGFRGPTGLSAWLDRRFKSSKSWMEAFETHDPRVAEERCRRASASFRWLPSGHLVVETVRPATLQHPETKRLSWFNQAHLFRWTPRFLGRARYALASAVFRDREKRSHDACFGDGSEIDVATLDRVFDVLDAHCVPISWRRGDVLWLDNLSCMHGRRPFVGERRVIVAMSSPMETLA